MRRGASRLCGLEGAGEPPRRAHPHTIESGAGEQLTFLARGRDEQGEYLEVRNAVAPGAGPPMHVHHLQRRR